MKRFFEPVIRHVKRFKTSDTKKTITQMPVSEGLHYSKLHVRHRHVMHVLTFDWSSSSLQLDWQHDDRLQALDQFDQSSAVARINGSFFNPKSQKPVYMMAENDQLTNVGTLSGENGYMQTPKAFGVTHDDEPVIDSFQLRARVKSQHETFNVKHFNVLNQDEEVLYTDSTFQYSISEGDTLVFIEVGNYLPMGWGQHHVGYINQIRQADRSETLIIPNNEIILKLPYSSNLKPGDTISLSFDIDDRWKDMRWIVASGPELVKGGEPNLDICPERFVAKKRAPRTVVAINHKRHEIYFMTVEGKYLTYHQGMSLVELSYWLAEWGADQALNLDGGSSSTMIVEDEVVNRPSAGVLEPIHNAFFITKK
ncbi:hypothetical protein ABID56_001151 [Alkalibacillus flavidus]|uniref:Phosphodiester glycosidase domain-containing protein n=1 Tax=Alkalibacillus flavidus TaxID=546021 RepID=A0ABV2KU03_9BACI